MTCSVRLLRVLPAALVAVAMLTFSAAPAQAMTPITCSVTSSNAGEDAAHELSNAPKVKVVYAYPQGGYALSPTRLDQIEAAVSAMRDKVEQASGGQKTVRFDLTASGCLDLGVIALSQGAGHYATYGPSVTLPEAGNLARAAFGGYKKFTILGEGTSGGMGGRGTSPQDTTPSAANRANDTGFASISDWSPSSPSMPDFVDQLAYTALHETFHTLGAVQPGAPGQTDGGHSADCTDLMGHGGCGTAGLLSAVHIDGGDTYFNVNPAPGSYLAGNYNIARDSLFLCPLAACDAAQAAPAITVSAGPATAGQPVAVTASGGVAYHWNVGGGYQLGPNATAGAAFTMIAQSAPTTVTVRGFNAAGAWSEASVTVTPAPAPPRLAPSPQFTWKAAGATKVALDASASKPGSFALTGYGWDVNGDSRADLHGRTVTYDLKSTSPRKITLIVTDASGNSAMSAQVVTASGSGSSGGTTSSVGDLRRTPAKQKRSTVKKKGVRVSGVATKTGKVTIRITAAKSVMRKLGAKKTTLATKTVKVRKGKTFTVQVKLPRKVAARVARQSQVKLTVTASGAAKGKRTVTIKR